MLDTLYQTCGYLASFLGTLIEGEILLITSVLSAKMGLFNAIGGLIAAFFGALTRDAIQFAVAKNQGQKLLNQKPKLQVKVQKASRWFERRPLLYLFLNRFIFGMSTIILVLSGLRNIGFFKFLLVDGLGVLIWVSLFGGLAFLCGDWLLTNLEFMSSHSWEIIAILVTSGLAYWYFVKRPREKECFSTGNKGGDE